MGLRALFILLPLLHALAAPKDKDGKLVFAFFRNNGETGLYLATSDDGRTWTPLNQDKPLLAPQVGESKLMRDPSILRGPDGTFHLVWTTSWQGKTLGYASSRDLKTWTPQRTIEPFPAGTNMLNCWAPELFYDAKSKQYWIIWASTIPGKFKETEGKGNEKYNHRLYAIHTKDFQSFSPAGLFYNPGFNVIDAVIYRDGNRYAMIAKNETQTPPAKYLFVTWADKLTGPWTPPTPNITGPKWAEGPTVFEQDGYRVVYFDQYRDHQYGALRSKDGKTWEELPGISLPKGIRHGTIFRAPAAVVEAIR